ncbi:MAG: PAS domain-containing protein [Steroidobacteraceae bacterium]
MAVEQYFASPLSHYDPADLLDALATGIVVLDAQLCVVCANVAAQGLLAMSFNQARRRPVQDMFIECNGLVATLRRADPCRNDHRREGVGRPAALPREPRVLDIVGHAARRPETGTHVLLELSDETQRARLTQEANCGPTEGNRAVDGAACPRDQESAGRPARRSATAGA